MSLVSLVLAEGGDSIYLSRAIEASLDLIHFNPEKTVKKVAIKPNLCYYYDWSTGETTDPKFVSVLIDILRKRLHLNFDIFVVESDASAMKCKYAFKMLGYEKIARAKFKIRNYTLTYRL